MQADEETPPALAPLFKVADVLEQEKNTDKTLAAQKILDAAQNYTNLPYAWWDYIGKGGTIYVHVLATSIQTDGSEREYNQNSKTKEPYILTRKHYEKAALIANERYKKLDVNLKVVMVFDENAKPLTKQEFMQRKADKKQRKALPKEFASEYNPMDSYVYVDRPVGLQQSQENMNKEPNNWQQITTSLEKKGAAFYSQDIGTTIGQSSASEFAAMISTGQLGLHFNQFIDDKQEEKGNKQLNDLISEALSCLIEHETGHIKFINYAENDNNYDNTRKNTEQFLFRNENQKYKGHVKETLMTTNPYRAAWANDTAEYDTYLGYDIYMQTMLQLLHGRHPENHKGKHQQDDIMVFYKRMNSLDNERRQIQADLLKMDKVKLASPEGIEKQKAFKRLDRITSAHFDMLTILALRTDTSDLIKSKMQPILDQNLEKQLKIPTRTHGQYTQETSPQD